MKVEVLLTIFASIFQTIGFLPYLWSSLFGKTRPHIFTWFIWGFTNGIAVAGLWLGGGGIGAIAPTIAAAFAGIIFLVSLRFGRRDLARSDLPVLFAVLSAIVVWWLFDNPSLAVLMVSAIDIMGYIPTFRKSYKDPYSENITSWAFFSLAAILAILALEKYNVLTLSYLLSIAFLNSALSIFLIIQRRRKKTKQPREELFCYRQGPMGRPIVIDRWDAR